MRTIGAYSGCCFVREGEISVKIIEKKSNILYNIEHKNRDHGLHGTGQEVVQMKALLTIDDVPEKVHREVTDYLLEKGIPAVFFAIGQSAETNRESIIYALQNGFHVGNHTYTHANLGELTYEEAIAEIEKCDAVIDSLYQEAGVERTYKLFRFPYLSKGNETREALQKYLRDNGFTKLKDDGVGGPLYADMRAKDEIDVGCSFDIQEYLMHGNPDIRIDWVLNRMEKGDEGNPLFGDDVKHIILLHTHDYSNELAPGYYKAIIEKMLENGTEFLAPEFL